MLCQNRCRRITCFQLQTRQRGSHSSSPDTFSEESYKIFFGDMVENILAYLAGAPIPDCFCRREFALSAMGAELQRRNGAVDGSD